VPDKEVRNLKITNGEVDYKQQAVFIEDFPLYKENEKNGNFTVDLSPGLGQNVFYSFNTTHKDTYMRQMFNDVRFLKAMSLALDREEINEIAYLGQGTPEQALPCDPRTVEFVAPEDLTYFIEYDPETAQQLLDEVGLVDKNGDDLRDRPDGKPFVIRLQFSNQGGPVRQHELAAGYWRDIGVRVDLKEVTSDEYRANASNNLLDVSTWYNDEASAPAISQTTWKFVPPFGSYFNPGTGWEWADWKKSGGKEGVEPPEDVKKLYSLADKFVQQPLGTAESNRIGREVVKIHLQNLWKIGTVGGILSPIVHHNRVGNFIKMTAKTYDYYWAYPYRPQQWYIK
jgi:peptide/nickel transport system substrate-binding protein